MNRNDILGINFLIVGMLVSTLGFAVAQSIPIASFGFALALMGALIVLIVPESIPQDAYRSLLKDSIANVEILLEESGLRNRAYFIRLEESGQIRAFIPLENSEKNIGENGAEQSIRSAQSVSLVKELNKAPRRLIMNYKGLRGLLIVPPGSEIVNLTKIAAGDDVEDALNRVLVDFSDIANSILVLDQEDQTGVRVLVKGPKVFSDSPYFNDCLGSPVGSIVACVLAAIYLAPVRIVDERFDDSQTRLLVEVCS